MLSLEISDASDAANGLQGDELRSSVGLDSPVRTARTCFASIAISFWSQRENAQP